jgi:shikimate kinase
MKPDPRAIRPVCLTGFMGAGKSTVARLLARQTGWEHFDLDKRIVDATGLSIPEIFARRGEPAFRQIESEQLARVLGEAAGGAKRIISLGGGTTVQPQNRELLQQHQAVLIWLDCPVDELLRRCAQITDRPLFRDEASFRALYEQRRPVYQLAHFRVESEADPLQIVEKILALGIFPKVTV